MSTLTAAAPPSSAENPTSKARYVLALGHLCSDINQGSLAALLPFLIAAHHYSYTTAATLVMVSNLAGSIIQPVFGHMSDKKNRPGFMLLGVSLAAGGMALTGYVTNFAGLCLAVMVSGIGVALFHPQAAKLVNAHDFITHMEHGYDSDVGEGGGQLSTGEKQLISFARAVLANPRIFVLDEATASIDTKTEALIQEAISTLLTGRTSFLIAHRLSTIRKADMILVVRAGKIIERGTHRELMALGGYYADLYNKQFETESAESVFSQ